MSKEDCIWLSTQASSVSHADHSVSEWLELHGVSSARLSTILGMRRYLKTGKSDAEDAQGEWFSDRSGPNAWAMARQALAAAFSGLKDTATEAHETCEVNFGVVDQPHIIDNGNASPPTVNLGTQTCAASLIDTAHEFSHTVQLIARRVDFIPPIMREIAAFLGELALIEYLEQNQDPAHLHVFQEWSTQNQRYLQDDLSTLQSALNDPNARYTYRQNYPPARILAGLMFQHIDRQDLTAVFDGRWSLSDCLDAVRHLAPARTMQNYFPDASERNTEFPAVEAYRALGMMAYLDLDYWQGQSETSIEDYYANLLGHMQSQTMHVVIGDDNKPMGYATWNVVADDPLTIEITRQSAPFGDFLQVQRSLRARLPDVTSARAIHERSARPEQVAW